MSAEEVLAAARRTVPEVSLSTMYNTPNELVRLGEVSEIHLADGSARYHRKVGPEHHHQVGEVCGLMLDVGPFGCPGCQSRRHNGSG